MQRYLVYAFALFGALVVFYVGLILFRKLGASSAPDPLSGLLGFNATDMKKRGLLTEDELKRVRAAMAKQVRKSALAPPPGAGTGGLNAEALLMSDPLVRQLEAAAETKKTAESAPGQISVYDGVPAPGQAAPAPADDTALPPDVLKMAELGLIAPDELEAIRARVRAKKAGLG